MFEPNDIPVDVLAIGAHPDDLELCCAGTLLRLKAQGYSVGLVEMTMGERGTRGSAELRMQEARAAMEILGFDFRENLNLGDMHIQDTQDRRRKVVECIRRHKPKLVFTQYYSDRHPDHEGTAQLVKHAMFFSGAGNFDAAGEPHTPKRLLYFYGGWVMEPNIYVDITDFYERKIEAARCYKSQFYDPASAERATLLSRPHFFEDLEVRFRNFGLAIGVKYAEAFHMREKVRVDDPVAMFAR